MTCPKCNTQNPEGFQFCINCGASLVQPNQPTQASQPQVPPSPETTAPVIPERPEIPTSPIVSPSFDNENLKIANQVLSSYLSEGESLLALGIASNILKWYQHLLGAAIAFAIKAYFVGVSEGRVLIAQTTPQTGFKVSSTIENFKEVPLSSVMSISYKKGFLNDRLTIGTKEERIELNFNRRTMRKEGLTIAEILKKK